MTDRPLWTVQAMAAAMGAVPAGPLPLSVPGISIDTRTVATGEAFFAIKGDNRDGHEFVEAALAAGAGLAVVAADRRDRFPDAAPLLVVADVLDGLRDLARAARARTQAKIVAVTGSVGKTSTKEALRLALGADGETHASVASYNNHWGVPLSLARCPETARYAVFEIGMNHAGEIEPLTRLVRPQVAIVTTVEPVHLEFFRSVEAIADAKAEIFLGLEPGGAAVINRDNPQFARLERAAQARRRRAHRLFRRTRARGCAADPMRAAIGGLHRRGADFGHRSHLQARCARPPSGAQLACRAGGERPGRRRSRARGPGARQTAAGERTRRARQPRNAGRHGAPDR